MKILVATDFSESARHATDHAAALAKRLGDQLLLVYVVEPPVAAAVDFDFEGLQRAVEERSRERMQEERRRLSWLEVPLETRIERGMVGEVIAKLSEPSEIRLVVAGSHGPRAVERFFLGSAAEQIVKRAHQPALIVRQTRDDSSPALARASRPLRLVIGIEPSHASAGAVQWVRDLRASIPCDLTFVHFYWPYEQMNRLGFQGSSNLLDPDPAVVGVLERDLRHFVGEISGTGTVEFQILPHWGDLGQHLAAFAEQRDADMLVLGAHQRGPLRRMWLGATKQPALRSSSVPVLCIPAPAETDRPRAEVKPAYQVLAATDFSPLANAAIPHSYGIVGAGGTVHLVHVHERHLPVSHYADTGTRGHIAGTAVERDLEDKLRALVPTDAAASGIKTEVHVVDGGVPAVGIIQTANRLGVDVICLASHGHPGIGKALLGWVSGAVIKHAERPVYLVPGSMRR